jgi:cytidyltransferase-like protein
MRIGIISGYFNPLHTGHLDYIEAAKKHCNVLYVIVNSDLQVTLKGSVPFMNQKDRFRIVNALQDVSHVRIAEDNDGTVVKTIQSIYEENDCDPFVESFTFMNGGDRVMGNTPEEAYCYEQGILTLYNVGGGKTQSSSTLIAQSKIHEGCNG